MSSLDALVKEFVAASNDEKKAMFSKIEEEVEKLKGSTERYLIGFSIFSSKAYFSSLPSLLLKFSVSKNYCSILCITVYFAGCQVWKDILESY